MLHPPAIYGSRAANGVILITTKRAEADKFTVSYNGYVGWQSAIDLPDKVGAIDHMLMTNTAYTNIGKSPLLFRRIYQGIPSGHIDRSGSLSRY